MTRRHALLLACCVSLAACEEDKGVTFAQYEEAAKDRVRQKLNLGPEEVLFSTVWIGKSRNDESVLCGRVAGAPANGAPFTPRRFIAGIEPATWLLFEPVTNESIPSQPGKFVEWATACAGEKGPD